MPAHWHYVSLMRREGRRDEARIEYERLAKNGDRDMQCFALMAGLPANGASSEGFSLVRLARARGVGPCLELLLPDMAPGGTDQPGLPPMLELRRRAARTAPEIAQVWLGLSLVMLNAGDTTAADSVLTDALRAVTHPMERVNILACRAWVADLLGRRALAEARWQTLISAVERDRRPGLSVALYFSYRSYANSPARPHTSSIPAELLAKASVGMRVGETFSQALVAAGSSNYAAAIPYFDTALALAAGMPDGQNIVAILVAKGRVQSKMGQLPEAERTLRAAQLKAAGSNQRYSQAEIWHNLSHTYEGMGRMADALAAVDSFVAGAAVLERDPVRIISRHDAGLLRLNLGLHAAAHSEFEAMVRLIESERHNHYWAGEYYERIGNPREAYRFFRRGADQDHGERSLNLAGLARVYEALGVPDSAAAAAHAHDAAIQSPTDVPLEPDVLARSGRTRDAIRIATAWAERREAGRNVQGAALARLQAARLYLADGQPTPARAEIRRANVQIAALSLASERIEALRIDGAAAALEGKHAESLAALREAVRLATRAADARQVRLANTALGDELAATGDVPGALQAYSRATVAVGASTSLLNDDVDRARYRAVHLAPFDAAMRLVLRAPESTTVIANWSARRKAAALALAARGSGEAQQFDLRRLQSRLAGDHAVVDYVVLPDLVAAIVVTRTATRVIPLRTSADTISALVRRTAVGFSSGTRQVDLARARFDTASAAALYSSLIAPLRPALAGVRRLTIIPDGPAYHVPFAALVDGGAFLLDEFEIDHALSLALAGEQISSWRERQLLLVSTDVPGAAAERRNIRDAWKGARIDELAGAAATEASLPRMAASAGIVHFAVHAEASDRSPLATHLRLSPDARNDGLLHLAEINDQSFANKLVVLAACESLVGPLLHGEGFMGLSRAFLAAGASGVVATRWPVGASSATFAAMLYGSLAGSGSPAGAVRAAQRALRANPATAHPFFWAGYVSVSGTTSRTF
jgi:CHAT domain-containing protein/tetratricopeptide (TPR) repeat protein